jgi:hypothetical protein
MTDALRTIMKTFAQANGLPQLERGRDGTYTLLFDQQWIVNITDDPATGRIHLFSAPSLRSDTGAAPPKAHAIDRFAPEWLGMSNGAPRMSNRIGIHRGSGLVLLDASADPALLDAIAFPLWLQDFVDHVVQWADALGDRGDSAPDQDDDPFGPAAPSCASSCAPSRSWPAWP